ncbi:MAG: hypothetical protein ACREEM_54395 [Blastocatellia bacterium]
MKLTAQALPMALLLVLVTNTAAAQSAAPAQQKQLESLSAAEFSRLVRDLSEEGGFFPSDNFTSNESSYLTVVDKLRQLDATGGAYIGVGPEQNFSYIAKVRPRIAFIVDIRRQAVIQHLMYKAIFHLAPTRAQFLSLLLSRPLPKEKAPKPDASIDDLVTYLNALSSDDKTYADNLAAIRKAITEEFQFPLNESDLKTLEHVYGSFRADGFEIGFRLSRRGNGPPGGFVGPPPGAPGGFRGGGGFGPFPNLREILTQTDLNGKQGSFLASVDDYEFVRGLQRKNLIIPVVGDFAGKKALAGVGEYLRKNGFVVTAFYTSNVEMVLFQNSIFEGFAANVKKLPVNDRSLIIRAAFSRYSHPARLPGYSTFTLLQQIPVFVKDFDEGRHTSYNELISTHYIAAEKPER